MNSTLEVVVALGCLLVAGGQVSAHDEGKPTKPPRVALAVPSIIAAGAETEVTLRGFALHGLTGVRFAKLGEGVSIEIVSKGESAPPNGLDAERVGDSEARLNLTVSDDVQPGEYEFVAVSVAGESRSYSITIAPLGSVVDEREPNDGFRQAQSLEAGATIRGKIGRNQDIDVFALQGGEGRTLVIDLRAERDGTPLDASLSLFTAEGRLLATVDDAQGRDPRLEQRLTGDGRYLIVVMDASDTGSPLHAYRLQVRLTDR